MFIIWGSKKVRKPLGRVAEYCPFCRDVRPLTLVRISKVSHIYYLPLGRGKPVGCLGTCEGCRTTMSVQEDEYGPPVKSRRRSLEDLIDETNPTVLQAWHERQAMEERAIAGELSPADRIALLAEPFYLLNPLVEERAASTHMDGKSGAGCLTAIALLFGFVIATAVVQTPTPWILWPIGIALALTVLYTVFQLHRDVPRFIRRTLHPRLRIALAPYAPTREELQAVLAQVRSQKCVIGAKLKLDALLEYLYPNGVDAT